MCIEDKRSPVGQKPMSKISLLGDVCGNDETCADGMYCNGGHCQCLLGYIGLSKKCLKLSSVCPTSHYFADQSSGKPQTCKADDKCPDGFTCQPHENNKEIGFCCYDSKEIIEENDVCGNAKPLLENGRPAECSIEKLLTCPLGYNCQHSTKMEASFCCRANAAVARFHPSKNGTEVVDHFARTRMKMIILANEVCSEFKEQPWFFENYPMVCKPNVSSLCPIDYNCRQKSDSDLHFCCRKIGNADENRKKIVICPNSEPNLVDGQPLTCVRDLLESCPENYTCEYHPGLHVNYCCSREDNMHAVNEAAGCPKYQMAAKDSTGRVMTCSYYPNSDKCPDGFSCVYSELNDRYQCCSRKESRRPPIVPEWKKALAGQIESNKYCLPGQRLYQSDEKTVRNCLPNVANACPEGYFCQFSMIGRKFVCCGLIAGCPKNSVAYLDPNTGQTETCDSRKDECPSGYDCQRAGAASICCLIASDGKRSIDSIGKKLRPDFSTITGKGPTNLCPAGDPLVVTGRKEYKTCDNRLNTCPSGYSCFPSIEGDICCPDLQTVCSKPMSVGQRCVSTSEGNPGIRYFFDPKRGLCQPFQFAGCKGNWNNFESLQDCSTFCITGLCAASPVEGNGVVGLQAQVCSKYSINQCSSEQTCVMKTFDRRKIAICCPKPEVVCRQTKNPGYTCIDQTPQPILRYFFDSRTGSCRSFLYNGCGGNDNNFVFVNFCETFCQMYANESSSGAVVAENGGGGQFFGQRRLPPENRRILPSENHQILPPENRLIQRPEKINGQDKVVDLEEKMDFKACPKDGDVMSLNVAYHVCRLNAPRPCPMGFTCQFSATINAFTCCGSPPGQSRAVYAVERRMQQCAKGQAFMYPGTYQPLMCTPGSLCPRNHECIWSYLDGYYVCCPNDGDATDLAGAKNH